MYKMMILTPDSFLYPLTTSVGNSKQIQPSAKSIKPSAACLASLLSPYCCCNKKREYCEEMVEMRVWKQETAFKSQKSQTAEND